MPVPTNTGEWQNTARATRIKAGVDARAATQAAQDLAFKKEMQEGMLFTYVDNVTGAADPSTAPVGGPENVAAKMPDGGVPPVVPPHVP